MKVKITIIILLICSISGYFIHSFFKEGCEYEGIIVTGDLELQSDNKGFDYCKTLKCSLNGYDNCTLELLKINNLYNSASYQHGEVLLQILERFGDEKFSKEIIKLTKNEINNLKEYFTAGMDVMDYDQNFIEKYPKTFNILKIMPATPPYEQNETKVERKNDSK